jgi:peptidyl-tRNA hydrolase, PTH1 family
LPLTYVNLSGEAVGAVARFYKLEPEEILVAYDEMAFEPGVVRLKAGGGDNGHNGIRSVIAGLATAATSCGCASAWGTRAIAAGSPPI